MKNWKYWSLIMSSACFDYIQVLGNVSGIMLILQVTPTLPWKSFLRTLEKFQFISTDYEMPELNGAELSRKFLKANPNIPIIIVSGYSCTFNKDDTM